MPQVIVSALGPDRPGIVARVTEVLVAHGCNIADSRMGLLSGRFTMMLVVDAPDALDEESFTRDLAAAGDELGLDAVHAQLVAAREATAAPTHVVTLYGADHPGIVHAVARAAVACGANITDLQTRLVDELYVVTLELAGDAGIEQALRAAAQEQQLEVSIRPVEPDVL